MRRHQIEELLLNAHLEREGGIDLIEEYFATSRSLDRVTRHARQMLQTPSDLQIRQAILRNLSECIVVKSERDKTSMLGMLRQVLGKLGICVGRSSEILRAEQLLFKFRDFKP